MHAMPLCRKDKEVETTTNKERTTEAKNTQPKSYTFSSESKIDEPAKVLKM
jgi:hypothetical protein